MPRSIAIYLYSFNVRVRESGVATKEVNVDAWRSAQAAWCNVVLGTGEAGNLFIILENKYYLGSFNA